jgi:hypothetical protein
MGWLLVRHSSSTLAQRLSSLESTGAASTPQPSNGAVATRVHDKRIGKIFAFEY